MQRRLPFTLNERGGRAHGMSLSVSASAQTLHVGCVDPACRLCRPCMSVGTAVGTLSISKRAELPGRQRLALVPELLSNDLPRAFM